MRDIVCTWFTGYQDVVFETANRRRRRDLDTARVANLIRHASDVSVRERERKGCEAISQGRVLLKASKLWIIVVIIAHIDACDDR